MHRMRRARATPAHSLCGAGSVDSSYREDPVLSCPSEATGRRRQPLEASPAHAGSLSWRRPLRDGFIVSQHCYALATQWPPRPPACRAPGSHPERRQGRDTHAVLRSLAEGVVVIAGSPSAAAPLFAISSWAWLMHLRAYLLPPPRRPHRPALCSGRASASCPTDTSTRERLRRSVSLCFRTLTAARLRRLLR